MSEATYFDFPMDNTLCKMCKHRFSRIIMPFSFDDWDIEQEIIDSIKDGEEIEIEQHVCLILQMDLDGVVTECNHYEDVNKKSIFFNNIFDDNTKKT